MRGSRTVLRETSGAVPLVYSPIFEDEELTKAITDRLRHHGKVIKITGPSYRTKNQKSEVTVS